MNSGCFFLVLREFVWQPTLLALVAPTNRIVSKVLRLWQRDFCLEDVSLTQGTQNSLQSLCISLSNHVFINKADQTFKMTLEIKLGLHIIE